MVKCKKGKVKGVLVYGGLQNTYNTPLNDAWFLDLSRDDFTSSSWMQVSISVNTVHVHGSDSVVQTYVMIMVI